VAQRRGKKIADLMSRRRLVWRVPRREAERSRSKPDGTIKITQTGSPIRRETFAEEDADRPRAQQDEPDGRAGRQPEVRGMIRKVQHMVAISE
jgi:hypothetical protein